jgi:hypothetical protein
MARQRVLRSVGVACSSTGRDDVVVGTGVDVQYADEWGRQAGVQRSRGWART